MKPLSKLSLSVRFIAAAILAIALAGCAEDISTVYGRRSGADGPGESVNGTAVFANMFRNEGHMVITKSRLSPAISENADVIVWFPDDPSPPSEEVREWLEGWLTTMPGRTLIYVGRDFDAAPGYWQHLLDRGDVPPPQQAEIKRRQSEADSRSQAGRPQLSAQEDAGWFKSDMGKPRNQFKKLSGPWSKGVDASKVGIELDNRLMPAEDTTVLLAADGEPIATREVFPTSYLYYGDPDEPVRSPRSFSGESQLIVVANGSFLLNLRLVNKENRKLAARVVESVGGPPQRVVFLESGRGGPPITSSDTTSPPSALALLGVWPLNVVIVHLALLGIVFCFARWAIFGRPRESAPNARSDFGKHIDALGELLEANRDREHALRRLASYQQKVGADGASRVLTAGRPSGGKN